MEPHHHVLEIGCGQGLAVSLVCERLGGGSITAIDRSAAMIAMARKRNAAHVASGRASFHCISLRDADFGGRRFDRVLAVNVGAFLRKDPGRELEAVRRCLAPGGTLHVVYQPPVASRAAEVAETLPRVLADHGFAIREVRMKDVDQARAVCVVARADRP